MNTIMSIDADWENFINGDYNDDSDTDNNSINSVKVMNENEKKNIGNMCEDLYISTQTKIYFLNLSNIDVNKIFWNIPVIKYSTPNNGVIKKQMRLVFDNKDDFKEYEIKRDREEYFTEKIMKQIDNPNARKIKFKDVRKITIGISKKDIMNCHGRNKNAFINCFALILRVKHNNNFHEIHVKVFNTGRIAIPGIVDDDLSYITKEVILSILQPHFSEILSLVSEDETPEVEKLIKGKKNKETNKREKSYFEKVKPKSNVLINSNFNCGYFINQEKLSIILKDKYNLAPTYDPSMYPGVKCKFYYKNDEPMESQYQNGQLIDEDQNITITELNSLTNEKYTKVSFMIFRTGNCLIVGNCTKEILTYVYNFIKNIFVQEYSIIHASHEAPVTKTKKIKIRKKTFLATKKYYDSFIINSKISIVGR